MVQVEKVHEMSSMICPRYAPILLSVVLDLEAAFHMIWCDIKPSTIDHQLRRMSSLLSAIESDGFRECPPCQYCLVDTSFIHGPPLDTAPPLLSSISSHKSAFLRAASLVMAVVLDLKVPRQHLNLNFVSMDSVSSNPRVDSHLLPTPLWPLARA